MSAPARYATEAAAPKVLHHSVELLRLAWPVMLSRAGILVMAFVDITMLGRYGEGAVGVSNLGLALFVPFMVVSIGFCSGLVPVASHAWGAGDRAEAGRAWRRALVWGAVVSTPAMITVWFGEHWLLLLGQDVELARRGGLVTQALAPGLIAQTLFTVSAFYLESTGRPFAALWAMVVANLVNGALNWVMIYGALGWPEMGATGAALASTIARFVAFAILLWVIMSQRDPLGVGVRGPWETFWGPGGWRAGTTMRRLGASAGLSNGFETIGFSGMAMIAGTLGVAALDAYSISHNLLSTIFMVGLGLSVATGVRVGQATGAGRPRDAAFAGWTGVLVAVALMGCAATLVAIFHGTIPVIYTDDPELARRAGAVILVSALVFVPDTLQVVMGQANRVLGDAWGPLLAYILSFGVVMIPLALWLTGPGGWDERGLPIAIASSCALASVLMAWRFRVLTRVRR